MIHSFLTEVWKFRCEVLHSTQNATVEIRMKMRAQEMLDYYKSHTWHLSKGGEYVVVQKKNAISSTDRSIRNWIESIESSVREKATRVQTNGYSTIYDASYRTPFWAYSWGVHSHPNP